MKFESVEQEIEMTVDWCVILWGANGIPPEKVAEMKGELEDHLRMAIRDGKSVDSVIGSNVNDFAAAWAVENRPPITFGERVMEWAGLLALSAVLVSVFGHVWYFSPTYSVEDRWWYAAPILITLPNARLKMPGVPSGHEDSLPVRVLISVCVGALAGMLMAGINVAVHLGNVSFLFEWSWVSTIVVVLLGAPLLKNRRRTNVLPILEEREEPRGTTG